MAPNRTHEPSKLSEADVQAFADGLLAPERAAEVERYLRGRPDEARRVAFYGRLNGMMQSSFQSADALDEPVPLRLRWRATLAVALRRWSRPVFAVLAIAIVAIGGFLVSAHVPQRGLENATLAALAAATADAAASTANRASPSAHADAAAAADAGAPDLAPVGMRVHSVLQLRVGGLWRVMGVVYLNGLNQPAVLVRVVDPTARPQPQWRARRIGNDRILMWTNGRVRYLLAGRADTRGLMRAADLMTMGSSLAALPAAGTGASNGASNGAPKATASSTTGDAAHRP